MPAMTESAAKDAVAQTLDTAAADAVLESALMGDGDELSGLGAAMDPPEYLEGTESEENAGALDDLDELERSLSGEESEDAEGNRISRDENEGDEEEEEADEPEEREESDEEVGDDADEEEVGDDEAILVSKSAMKELYGKYNAALEAAKGQQPAQEAAEDGAGEAKDASPEEQARSYAETLSASIQVTEMSEEQAEKFGIQDREGFNEFFGEVQRGLGAQAMATISGQLPQMIINQASQAMPYMLAAQTFIDKNPEWEEHPAIVEAALVEAKQAHPNASPRKLVNEMERRIKISHKKGEAIAGKKSSSKKHDARKKTKGQLKGNRSARNTGGKQGKKVVGTEAVMRDMFGGSLGETDSDLDML